MTGTSRRLTGMVLALTAVIALAACGDGATRDVDPAAGTTPATSATSATATGPGGSVEASASATPSGDPLSRIEAARKVLADAGLALPQSTTAADVAQIPKEPFTERYLVTLSAPKAQIDAMCKAAGLGGPLVAARLNAEQKDAFGMQEPPTGARICSGLDPQNLARQREVLYTGDPATVWVAVWLMPSR